MRLFRQWMLDEKNGVVYDVYDPKTRYA
jgi:hypothetical protein